MQHLNWSNLIVNPDADFPEEITVAHAIPFGGVVVAITWMIGDNPNWEALEYEVDVNLMNDDETVRQYKMTDTFNILRPLEKIGFGEEPLNVQRMLLLDILTYLSLRIAERDYPRAITQNPVENTLVWGDPAEA